MINSKKFIDSYLSWLKENMSIKTIKDDVLELTSPFLDRHNDYMQIYIIKTDNGYILSDDGYTINDLMLSGLEFNTAKRKKILNTILNGYGVELDENDILKVKCNIANFPIKKHNLLQAMLSVNDLFVLSRNNVISIFLEDVETFLYNNDIRYISNVNFVGKSGLSQKFDFAIPKSKKMPERIIKTANNLNKSLVESIIFSWNDTKSVRDNNTQLYTFINDIDKNISNSLITAFKEYDIIPVRWSERKKYIEELAA
ncbi:DUF1829 domain-containing protein [Paramaledivibacter caminithermalis]|jgi:hypothetical protein|uniref:DUF1828 domain-containing protein n=1 Tax=Paramaledivibacter caminithermalis (strain DSM 15212 / CIP 107654 / DViRD3) TaxID=1121301 RepID=A0A1M6TE51_PARC5|nr:DUF1829 domain-containing protein [Paramaledivibacter caminithermalis]SHK55154.1 protein of unknown function DUF1828 [Paramaledivibacter caminithermalis DSM 15212]